MRLTLAALIALPLLLAAGPSLADAPTDQNPAPNATVAPPTPPVKAKPKLDPNQVICKREGTTGSRIGSDETCMTRAQWDDLASESQQRFNDERQNGNLNAPPKSSF